MIIWSGYGFLVPLIAMAAIALAQIAATSTKYDTNPLSGIVTFLMLALAGAAIWFLGKKFNTAPGRAVIDKQTGKEIVLRRKHSLFFVPMEYWGPIIAAGGLLMAFAAK